MDIPDSRQSESRLISDVTGANAIHLRKTEHMASLSVSMRMTANPEVVRPSDSLLVVKRMFEQQRFHHHIPVVDGGELVGIISLYDFIIAMRGASLDDTEPVYTNRTAGEIMSRDVITCEPHTPLPDAVRIMLDHTINALPVVKGRTLEGIITSRDVLRSWLDTAG